MPPTPKQKAAGKKTQGPKVTGPSTAYQRWLAELAAKKAAKVKKPAPPIVAGKPPGKAPPRSHVVKKDETFSTIAEKYKTTPQSLINAAGIENLKAGQSIQLPPLQGPVDVRSPQERRAAIEQQARIDNQAGPLASGRATQLETFQYEEPGQPDYLAGGPTSLVPKTFDDKIDNIVNRGLFFLDTVLAPGPDEDRPFAQRLQEGAAGPFTLDRMEEFRMPGQALGPPQGPLGIPGVGGGLGGARDLASQGYARTDDTQNRSVGDNIHYNGYVIPRDEFADFLKNIPVPEFDMDDPNEYWQRKIFHEGTKLTMEAFMWGLRLDDRDMFPAVVTMQQLLYYDPNRDWGDYMSNILNYRWDAATESWIKQEEDARYPVGGTGSAGYGGGWAGSGGGAAEAKRRGGGQFIRAGDPTQIGRGGRTAQIGGISPTHWRI